MNAALRYLVDRRSGAILKKFARLLVAAVPRCVLKRPYHAKGLSLRWLKT